MLKKILLLFISFVLVTYFVFAIVYINPKAQKEIVCSSIQISIMDTLDQYYIDHETIQSALKKSGLNLEGKKLAEIDTELIENKLEENKLIKRIECYKTIDGIVKIKVFQRKPVLRIFTPKGSYYIDNEQEIMPVPDNLAAYVLVASGNIEDSFAKEELYKFAVFLQKDKFWNSQIEQMYIAENGDIEITPRVGNHQIILGKIEDAKVNLEKLRLFYEKGLNKVGWNKYSVINLKYKDQVVCTKRDKK